MLQEFNAEKEERSKQFEALKEKSENESKLSMDLFGEDWNASQVLPSTFPWAQFSLMIS